MEIRPMGASIPRAWTDMTTLSGVTFHSFANAPKTWILLTFHSVFCVIHTVNSDYFPTQHYIIGRNSGVLCAVRTDECQSSTG